jgi:hypothetical protein
VTREEIARHRRWYGHGVFVYEPLHYLTLIETKPNALNQSAPLQGWDLPETFQHLSHLLEARIGNRGKREFVQVLRLMEGALEGDHDDRRDSGDPARSHRLRRGKIDRVGPAASRDARKARSRGLSLSAANERQDDVGRRLRRSSRASGVIAAAQGVNKMGPDAMPGSTTRRTPQVLLAITSNS